MGIEDIFIWYQRKIGTYDKQQWETTIEKKHQKFLYGFEHVQLRSTKPNTDLIDLDLVRGSSFTKAKPQHGFITVAKLATLRCVLLPLYSKWWIRQTSETAFIFILILHLAQILNIIVYIMYTANNNLTETLSCMELLVPFTLMWVLSLIHSQIVATSPETDLKKNEIKIRQSRRQRLNYLRQQRMLEKNNESIRKRADKTDKKEFTNRKNKKLQFTDAVLVKDALAMIVGPSLVGPITRKRTAIDDDGFESLNGNGSRTSEEEILPKRGINVIVETKESLNASVVEKSATDSFSNVTCKRCNKWFAQIAKKNSSEFSDTDSDPPYNKLKKQKQSLGKRRNSHIPIINVTSALDSTCDTEDEVLTSPEARHSCPLLGDVTSSATEWLGVTTNSEDYSSDTDHVGELSQGPKNSFDNDLAPTAILNPPSVTVSCIIWAGNDIKKADLSMLDISSAIIGKVDLIPETRDYFYIGIVISTILAFLPSIFRFWNCYSDNAEIQLSAEKIYKNVTMVFFAPDSQHTVIEICTNVLVELPVFLKNVVNITLGLSFWERTFVVITTFQRWILASMVFFLLSVAERTFTQRLLYAKLFSHLTSSRRARKSDLPHFRLNKVRNIKTWLSVRSYLKMRGPQRSVDVIVSTAFIISLLLLTFLCVELLKETVSFSQYYVEALIWCLGLGVLLLRFMTLGTKINKKYRNLSVLITEQINLHLQIEQKPHKKEELTVANNVLKLAIDLLKELENPFKISGLSANPILYNVTKLVILSALSGVLSEMLGFKLKLHKIKLK